MYIYDPVVNIVYYPGYPPHPCDITIRILLGVKLYDHHGDHLSTGKYVYIFFLERLVFLRQHTGVAISPCTFLLGIVCLKNHESYMIPLYFRFKLCTHCLNFIDFAVIPVNHL